MSEFLSSPDLHTLTGYAQPFRQMQWLGKHGIPFRRQYHAVIVFVSDALQWIEGIPFQTKPQFDWKTCYLKPSDEMHAAGTDHPSVTCGVYMLLNGEYINYIGQSKSVSHRIKAHLSKLAIPFTRYCAVEVPADELDFIERAHIHAFEPPFNGVIPRVTHKDHDQLKNLLVELWDVQREGPCQ